MQLPPSFEAVSGNKQAAHFGRPDLLPRVRSFIKIFMTSSSSVERCLLACHSEDIAFFYAGMFVRPRPNDAENGHFLAPSSIWHHLSPRLCQYISGWCLSSCRADHRARLKHLGNRISCAGRFGKVFLTLRAATLGHKYITLRLSTSLDLVINGLFNY